MQFIIFHVFKLYNQNFKYLIKGLSMKISKYRRIFLFNSMYIILFISFSEAFARKKQNMETTTFKFSQNDKYIIIESYTDDIIHIESGINNQYTVTMTSVQGMEGTFAAPIAATNFFIVLKSPLSGVSGSVIKFYYASAMYGELTFSSTSGGGAGTATCTLDTGFATLTRKFSDGYYLIEVADGYVVIYYLEIGRASCRERV